MFLTDAYAHFPDQTIVVTAAVALQAKDGANAGVVSVAITLTDLAEMLTRLRVAGRPIRGFGIHTDRVIVGNFGAPDRFVYTAIGDGVNLAARLERVNNEYGTAIIASDPTRRLAGDSIAW